MRKKLLKVIPCLFFLVAIISLILGIKLICSTNRLNSDTTILAGDDVTKTLEFNNLTLIPAQATEYNVNLDCKIKGSFEVYIKFYETLNGGLKEYVNLCIETKDFKVYQGEISNLLDNNSKIFFSCDLWPDKPFIISFIYNIPKEVGNEAQEKFLDFKVDIMIKRKMGAVYEGE